MSFQDLVQDLSLVSGLDRKTVRVVVKAISSELRQCIEAGKSLSFDSLRFRTRLAKRSGQFSGYVTIVSPVQRKPTSRIDLKNDF